MITESSVSAAERIKAMTLEELDAAYADAVARSNDPALPWSDTVRAAYEYRALDCEIARRVREQMQSEGWLLDD